MKKNFLSLVCFICFLVVFPINAKEITPFTSDDCSLFPDGTFEQNELWLSCCTTHDYAYWQGGTFEQRLLADQQLQSCVIPN